MATVNIGCKLPLGLVLELISKGNKLQPGPRGETVTLAGANSLRIKGTNPGIGQFALTQVDKPFWDKWYDQNKDLKFVKDGLVFMHESVAGANGYIKEHADLTTGLEPLNPLGDKRTEKGVTADKDQLKRLGVAA